MNDIEALVQRHPAPWSVTAMIGGTAGYMVLDARSASVLSFVERELADALASLPEVAAALRETDTLLSGGYVTADGWDFCERRSAHERIDRVRKLVRDALTPKETT
jgi:hypothetical protein